MSSVFFATPALDGRVHIQYALSLTETAIALLKNGHALAPRVVAASSLLVAERNLLVQSFWDSGCDYMLCVDSDLGWPAEAVISMLNQNKEFICGVYPARGSNGKEFLFRPVLTADSKIVQEGHLLKMEYIPAGFMLISRSAIAKMQKKFPELYYAPKNPTPGNPSPAYCFFNTEIYDGEFWGEDFVFCRRAREAGVELWCDPLIEFDHAGDRGMLLPFLRPGLNVNELPKNKE